MDSVTSCDFFFSISSVSCERAFSNLRLSGGEGLGGEGGRRSGGAETVKLSSFLGPAIFTVEEKGLTNKERIMFEVCLYLVLSRMQ